MVSASGGLAGFPLPCPFPEPWVSPLGVFLPPWGYLSPILSCTHLGLGVPGAPHDVPDGERMELPRLGVKEQGWG